MRWPSRSFSSLKGELFDTRVSYQSCPNAYCRYVRIGRSGGVIRRIGRGWPAVRQFLAAGLIDYMHVVVVPVLLGRGESLWDGLQGLEERFAIESASSPSGVTHVTFTRR